MPRRYLASSPVAALGSRSPGTSTRQRTCTRARARRGWQPSSPQQTGLMVQPDASKLSPAESRLCAARTQRACARQVEPRPGQDGQDGRYGAGQQRARACPHGARTVPPVVTCAGGTCQQDRRSRTKYKLGRGHGLGAPLQGRHLGRGDGVEEDGRGLREDDVPVVGVRQRRAPQQQPDEERGVRDLRGSGRTQRITPELAGAPPGAATCTGAWAPMLSACSGHVRTSRLDCTLASSDTAPCLTRWYRH